MVISIHAASCRLEKTPVVRTNPFTGEEIVSFRHESISHDELDAIRTVLERNSFVGPRYDTPGLVQNLHGYAMFAEESCNSLISIPDVEMEFPLPDFVIEVTRKNLTNEVVTAILDIARAGRLLLDAYSAERPTAFVGEPTEDVSANWPDVTPIQSVGELREWILHSG